MVKIDFTLWDKHKEGAPPEEGEHVPYVDLLEELPPVPYLFSLKGEHGLLPEGGLQCIQGKEKCGKSTFGVALIISALKGEFLGITPNVPQMGVLWVDTEQDIATLQRKARATLKQANKPFDTPLLRVVSLVGTPIKERLGVLLRAMTETGARLVFLDGIADLNEDFNDNKESEKVFEELLRITSATRSCIVCVIHENPNKEKARGHTGTILAQKSTQNFQVTKCNNVATVRFISGRFQNSETFPLVGFSFGENFEILGADCGKEAHRERVREGYTELFNPIFRNAKAPYISAKTLWGEVMIAKGVQKTRARDIIREACENGYLMQERNGRFVQYSLADFQVLPPEEDEEDL